MFTRIFCVITLSLTSLIPPSTAVLNAPHQNIVINLSTPSEDNKPQTVFTTKLLLNEGDVIIDIVNATTDYGFFIIQAHSFLYNISLSNSKDVVVGTNIGLVENPLMTNTDYHYYLEHIETQNVEVLLAVIVYKVTDPIPGGCNLVYNTQYTPYQIITYDENMIIVDASPPKAISCNVISLPRVDMYQLYLDEEMLDKTSYFNGISNFLTVDHIKKYGKKVSDSVKHLPLRRYYSAYRGTGSVFAIIATFRNSSAAYVPAVSYACNTRYWEESCVGPVTTLWRLLCAAILFVGMFMCYFGHRFFRITMFLFGLIFGTAIFYITINITNTVTMEQSVGYALLFGCAYGLCWLLLWWRYGIPILSVSLPVIFIGYITACIVLHTGIGDLRIFESDLNYWGVVFCITIPITVTLLLFTEFANILACSVVGGTAAAIAIDHYSGGSIHYIILNNIRRAIVPKFYLAILDAPFQNRDLILTFAWIGLVLFGVISQRKQQKGKPPFPPHRTFSRVSSERTPLLVGSTNSNIESGGGIGNQRYT